MNPENNLPADRISVVINTYNAADMLELTLKSVQTFDEVVVCDMESTDDTVAIAERYGCKIVTFPRGDNNICEVARDFAVHSASSLWVLVVDADEIVPRALRDYLYEAIRRNDFGDALATGHKNMFMGRPATDSPNYHIRFFRQDKAYWPPIIHAPVKIDGTVTRMPAGREDLYFIHLDDRAIADRITKLNRYSDNEVPKRMKRSFGPWKLLFRPGWFFFKTYILNGGFRDGRRGIIRAYMESIYQMMLMGKVIESQEKEKSES